MRKNNFIYATATTVELKAYGFDLTDTLRYLLFCKLQNIELDQFFEIQVYGKKNTKAILNVDEFLLTNESIQTKIEPQELCRLIALIALEKMKLSEYFHRIDRSFYTTEPEDIPTFTSFDIEKIGWGAEKIERLYVYMCLKHIRLDTKYTKFIAAGYQKMEYFGMANEQDLAELTLSAEEIEVFTKKYLICLATNILVKYELLNLNAIDAAGCTPLHWAARNNNPDVCRSLLRAGCEKNPTDNMRRTPLHLAAIGNSPNCIRVLILAKAKKNPRDISCK